ncbi:uncharacterized protein LOC112577430 isoform X2 [Pomacea canaliculata]|nr:uncharacterized protein LOC112577430 isoform X2 [Pomacea canaliculata]XP_025116285.1 uncharacterized protein LOC112577430 isoform X2 [Pomacea canaliculata]XP_025116287.1 uncharacterized protein LOC112577430 isoform X2 [Pomacea canaliculata]
MTLATSGAKGAAMVTLLLVAMTVVCVPGAQPRSFTQTEIAQLDRFVMEVMRCARIPALSLSLVSDDDVVYEKGYGTANPTTRTPTTKDTVFCLGSFTQSFTSVLLADLLSRNENKTFETPLRDIMGSRIHLPGHYRADLVNLKDILSMRTGLSNMDIIATAVGVNRYRLMEQNLRFAPEVTSFRESYVFNEILFSLVEEAARALGGNTWYRLLRQHVFNRLGMENVAFVHMDAKENNKLASPVHSLNGKPVQVPMDAYKGQELVAAASSVCASASDMTRWMQFILSGGKKDDSQVMRRDVLQNTFQPVQPRPRGSTRLTGFSQPDIQVSYTRESNSLGWINGHYRGYAFVSQEGSLPGYESLITLLVDRKAGVFTAFTGDGGARAYAAKTLINTFALDMLLQGNPWVDSTSVCHVMDTMTDMTRRSEPHPTRVSAMSEPIRPLEDYEGTYRHYGYGDVFIRRNGSELHLEYGELGRYILTPSSRNDTFIIQANSGPLWYTTNADEYRSKGPYLAFFDNRYNDPERRPETVTIPFFSSDIAPVFSKHPVRPVESEQEDVECDACANFISVPLILTAAMSTMVVSLR